MLGDGSSILMKNIGLGYTTFSGARTRYEQHQIDSKKEKHADESSRKIKLVLEEIKEHK